MQGQQSAATLSIVKGHLTEVAACSKGQDPYYANFAYVNIYHQQGEGPYTYTYIQIGH